MPCCLHFHFTRLYLTVLLHTSCILEVSLPFLPNSSERNWPKFLLSRKALSLMFPLEWNTLIHLGSRLDLNLLHFFLSLVCNWISRKKKIVISTLAVRISPGFFWKKIYAVFTWKKRDFKSFPGKFDKKTLGSSARVWFNRPLFLSPRYDLHFSVSYCVSSEWFLTGLTTSFNFRSILKDFRAADSHICHLTNFCLGSLLLSVMLGKLFKINLRIINNLSNQYWKYGGSDSRQPASFLILIFFPPGLLQQESLWGDSQTRKEYHFFGRFDSAIFASFFFARYGHFKQQWRKFWAILTWPGCPGLKIPHIKCHLITRETRKKGRHDLKHFPVSFILNNLVF